MFSVSSFILVLICLLVYDFLFSWVRSVCILFQRLCLFVFPSCKFLFLFFVYLFIFLSFCPCLPFLLPSLCLFLSCLSLFIELHAITTIFWRLLCRFAGNYYSFISVLCPPSPLPLPLPIEIALSLVTAFLVIAHSASLKIKKIKRTHHVNEQYIIFYCIQNRLRRDNITQSSTSDGKMLLGNQNRNF